MDTESRTVKLGGYRLTTESVCMDSGRRGQRSIAWYSLALPLILTMSLVGGCSSSPDSIPVPTLPGPNAVTAIGTAHVLQRIEGDTEQACPIDDKGNLLIFTGEASASKDAKKIMAGKTVILPGQEFETGQFKELKDGYNCGGKHYAKAIHLQVPDVTVPATRTISHDYPDMEIDPRLVDADRFSAEIKALQLPKTDNRYQTAQKRGFYAFGKGTDQEFRNQELLVLSRDVDPELLQSLIREPAHPEIYKEEANIPAGKIPVIFSRYTTAQLNGSRERIEKAIKDSNRKVSVTYQLPADILIVTGDLDDRIRAAAEQSEVLTIIPNQKR